MTSIVKILRRNDRVQLKDGLTPLPKYCLKAQEVGVIVQCMRDQQAWRLRREKIHLFQVRGPRGETTIFQPHHLQLAPPSTIPSLPLLNTKPQGSCREEGDEECTDASRGVAKPQGCCREEGDEEYTDASRGVAPACEDAPECESDNDADPWSETFEEQPSGETKTNLSLRTPSAVDRDIRIAYWRDPVKVAKEKKKYNTLGTPPPKTQVLCRLENESHMNVTQITAHDILHGRLTTARFDVLVVPGGYAPNYCDAIDDDGGDKAIQQFVANGGGFVGICAGAYCGSNWGWGLVDVDVMDIEHWNRGMSQRCFLQYTKQGHAIMVAEKEEQDEEND